MGNNSACGFCCSLYTGSSQGGVPVFGAAQSVVLVLAMLLLLAKLQLAYYASYNRQRSSVRRLLTTARQRRRQTDSPGSLVGGTDRTITRSELMLKPAYYVFVQATSLFFIFEAFVVFSLSRAYRGATDPHDVVALLGRYGIFAVCAFFDNLALLLLCGPHLEQLGEGTAKTTGTLRAVLFAGAITLLYWVLVFALPQGSAPDSLWTDAACVAGGRYWCGAHFPLAGIEWPYMASGVVYLCTARHVWQRRARGLLGRRKGGQFCAARRRRGILAAVWCCTRGTNSERNPFHRARDEAYGRSEARPWHLVWPRAAARHWSLFIGVVYVLAATGAALLHYGSAHAGADAHSTCTEAGYCTLIVSIAAYIVGYAPMLFTSFTEDTAALRKEEVRVALSEALRPLANDSNTGAAQVHRHGNMHRQGVEEPLLVADSSITAVSESRATDAHKDWSLREITTLLDGRASGIALISSAEIELEGRLGVGGCGEVFEGRWQGSAIAVKRMLGRGIRAEDMRKTLRDFLREVRVLRQLRHPHTVLMLGACIDFGRDDRGSGGTVLDGAVQFPMDRLAIITELCAGGSLFDLLDRHRDQSGVNSLHRDRHHSCSAGVKPSSDGGASCKNAAATELPRPPQTLLNWRQRVQIARDCACGVAYLHAQGIIHRDLKSHNILLSAAPGQAASAAPCNLDATAQQLRQHQVQREPLVCKVCDFGLSSIKRGAAAAADSHDSGFGAALEQGSTANKLAGTVQWAAPELLRDDMGLDDSGSGIAAVRAGAADTWAFGVIMWELATLQLPYGQYSALQAAVAVAQRGERLSMPPREAVPCTSTRASAANGPVPPCGLLRGSAAECPESGKLRDASLSCAWPSDVYAQFSALATQCLHEAPLCRPSFASARELLDAMLTLTD